MLIRKHTWLTLITIIVIVLVPPSKSWPFSGIFYSAEQEKNSIGGFVEKVAADWDSLTLSCDDKKECHYNIDPDMSVQYSDLYLDSCSMTSINESKLVEDEENFEAQTVDGTIIAMKTIRIPNFSVNCNVHFNEKDSGSVAASYMIKGTNSKSTDFNIGFKFDAGKKTTKIFMGQPKGDLDLNFVARYKYKYNKLKKYITTRNVKNINNPLAKLLSKLIKKSFESKDASPVLVAYGLTTTMSPNEISSTEELSVTPTPILTTEEVTTTAVSTTTEKVLTTEKVSTAQTSTEEATTKAPKKKSKKSDDDEDEEDDGKKKKKTKKTTKKKKKKSEDEDDDEEEEEKPKKKKKTTTKKKKKKSDDDDEDEEEDEKPKKKKKTTTKKKKSPSKEKKSDDEDDEEEEEKPKKKKKTTKKKKKESDDEEDEEEEEKPKKKKKTTTKKKKKSDDDEDEEKEAKKKQQKVSKKKSLIGDTETVTTESLQKEDTTSGETLIPISKCPAYYPSMKEPSGKGDKAGSVSVSTSAQPSRGEMDEGNVDTTTDYRSKKEIIVDAVECSENESDEKCATKAGSGNSSNKKNTDPGKNENVTDAPIVTTTDDGDYEYYYDDDDDNVTKSTIMTGSQGRTTMELMTTTSRTLTMDSGNHDRVPENSNKKSNEGSDEKKSAQSSNNKNPPHQSTNQKPAQNKSDQPSDNRTSNQRSGSNGSSNQNAAQSPVNQNSAPKSNNQNQSNKNNDPKSSPQNTRTDGQKPTEKSNGQPTGKPDNEQKKKRYFVEYDDGDKKKGKVVEY